MFKKNKNQILDKFLGCIIGGACGDALGYDVEFLKISEIKRSYGEGGIKKYRKFGGVAEISDDTQMTMFTISGIICADIEEKDINESVYKSYLNWLSTQMIRIKSISTSWLCDLEKLYSNRAPGNTCLEALMSGKMGKIDFPLNDSKGCGGVMRVAPVGLYFANKENGDEDATYYGASIAAITHSNPLGFLSAALLSLIIYKIMNNDNLSLEKIVKEANEFLLNEEPKDYSTLYDLVNLAINLSKNNEDDVENIEKIGQGWIGDEAIAIAIYCSLKYSNDFAKAIIAAVNHSGDSDSTGAICGNIVGCFLGYENIPKRYINDLELLDELEELSTDLYNCVYENEYFKNDNKIKNKYF